jgi:hypothetical protein
MESSSTGRRRVDINSAVCWEINREALVPGPVDAQNWEPFRNTQTRLLSSTHEHLPSPKVTRIIVKKQHTH